MINERINCSFSQKCLEMMKILKYCKINEIDDIILNFSKYIDEDKSLDEVYKIIGWKNETKKMNGYLNASDILKILYNIYQRSLILDSNNDNTNKKNHTKEYKHSPIDITKNSKIKEVRTYNKRTELTEERILKLREKVISNRNQEKLIKLEKIEFQKYLKRNTKFDNIMNNPFKHNLKKITHFVKNYILKNNICTIEEIKIEVLFKVFGGTEIDISEKIKIDNAINLSLKIMQAVNFIFIIPKEKILCLKSKTNIIDLEKEKLDKLKVR
jgi:hypothetical protein